MILRATEPVSSQNRYLCARTFRDLLHQCGKRIRLAHCQVRELFSVYHNAGFRLRVHESAVCQSLQTNRSIDPLNPQGTKHALAVAAVAVGILSGTVDRLLRNAKGVLPASVVALRARNYLAMPCMGRYSAFYPSHRRFTCMARTNGRAKRPKRLLSSFHATSVSASASA